MTEAIKNQIDFDVRAFAEMLTELPARTPIASRFEDADPQKDGHWWASQREHMIFFFLGEGFGAEVVASVLYVGFFATAINLVPLFGLDGHKILSHSLGVWDISSEGRSWIVNVFSHKSPHKHFGFGVKAFAIFELLAMTAMTVGSTLWWVALLAPKVGVMWAILIVILIWFVAGSVFIFFVLRNRKKKL